MKVSKVATFFQKNRMGNHISKKKQQKKTKEIQLELQNVENGAKIQKVEEENSKLKQEVSLLTQQLEQTKQENEAHAMKLKEQLEKALEEKKNLINESTTTIANLKENAAKLSLELEETTRHEIEASETMKLIQRELSDKIVSLENQMKEEILKNITLSARFNETQQQLESLEKSLKDKEENNRRLGSSMTLNSRYNEHRIRNDFKALTAHDFSQLLRVFEDENTYFRANEILCMNLLVNLKRRLLTAFKVRKLNFESEKQWLNDAEKRQTLISNISSEITSAVSNAEFSTMKEELENVIFKCVSLVIEMDLCDPALEVYYYETGEVLKLPDISFNGRVLVQRTIVPGLRDARFGYVIEPCLIQL